MVQASSVLSARCDQLVRELDSAKKMLAGMDEENAQLNDLLRVCHIFKDDFWDIHHFIILIVSFS